MRDVTPEEYEKYKQKLCTRGDSEYCKECMFRNVRCRIPSLSPTSWILHKDLYSDKFLDQEIEVEVPESKILTKEEKEYLKAVIKPFRERIKFIKKSFFTCGYSYIYIEIDAQGMIPGFDFDSIYLPVLEDTKMYKGMELEKKYTLKELELENE